MSRVFKICALGTVIGLCAAASPALAQYPTKYEPAPSSAVPLTATATTRVFGLINADATIARSVGITAVTSIATGEYCVTIDKKVLKAANAVPVMSFNYSSSADFDVFIAYAPSIAPSCPANSVPVITYHTDAGGHTFANEGFTIIVP